MTLLKVARVPCLQSLGHYEALAETGDSDNISPLWRVQDKHSWRPGHGIRLSAQWWPFSDLDWTAQ